MILIWLWKRLNKTGARPEVSGRLLRRFPEAEINKLLRARILIEDRKIESWGTCAHCDCGYDARVIQEIDGKLVACCPLDPSQDVILEPNDLIRYRIDGEQLIAAIAAAGKLAGTPAAISAGLWSMGKAATGRSIFLCRSPRDVFVPGISMLLKSLAGGMPPIVVFDEIDQASGIRLRDMEIDVHNVSEVLRADGNGGEMISFDGLLPAGNRVRLIIDRSIPSVMLDGRVLDMSVQMVAVLVLLAEQACRRDPIIKKQIIEAETGRPPNEVIRDLRKALVAPGAQAATAKELIATVHGVGYRLGLAPDAISFADEGATHKRHTIHT
jgi:DNA-binding winged helix-turn-helix (wHTH) protein